MKRSGYEGVTIWNILAAAVWNNKKRSYHHFINSVYDTLNSQCRRVIHNGHSDELYTDQRARRAFNCLFTTIREPINYAINYGGKRIKIGRKLGCYTTECD